MTYDALNDVLRPLMQKAYPANTSEDFIEAVNKMVEVASVQELDVLADAIMTIATAKYRIEIRKL